MHTRVNVRLKSKAIVTYRVYWIDGEPQMSDEMDKLETAIICANEQAKAGYSSVEITATTLLDGNWLSEVTCNWNNPVKSN